MFLLMYRLKKIEHNYTEGVRKQISRTKKQGVERVRQSAMTAIFDDKEQKFDFSADAYLVRQNQMHMEALATTGMRNPMIGAES